MAQERGIRGQDPSPAVAKGHPPPHYPQYMINILQAPGQDLTPASSREPSQPPGSLFLPTIRCPSYSWKNLFLDMDFFLGGHWFH